MTRANWKGKFINQRFLTDKILKQKTIIVFSRNSAIPANLLGKMVSVYNGKDFRKVFITRAKIGFKFGEFSLTKKFTKKQSKVKDKVKGKKKTK